MESVIYKILKNKKYTKTSLTFTCNVSSLTFVNRTICLDAYKYVHQCLFKQYLNRR